MHASPMYIAYQQDSTQIQNKFFFRFCFFLCRRRKNQGYKEEEPSWPNTRTQAPVQISKASKATPHRTTDSPPYSKQTLSLATPPRTPPALSSSSPPTPREEMECWWGYWLGWWTGSRESERRKRRGRRWGLSHT